MAKTREDLINQIAEELGVLATGQTLSAEDSDVIDRRIDPVNEMLSQKNICFIPDLDDIDDAYFIPFANVVAYRSAKPFGVTGQPLVDLKAKHDEGIDDLYDLSRTQSTRQVLNMDRWWGWQRGWGR